MELKTSDGQHLVSDADFNALKELKNDLPEVKRSLMTCIQRLDDGIKGMSKDKDAKCKLFRVLCDVENKVKRLV